VTPLIFEDLLTASGAIVEIISNGLFGKIYNPIFLWRYPCHFFKKPTKIKRIIIP
jgi:hypothetical protein